MLIKNIENQYQTKQINFLHHFIEEPVNKIEFTIK